MRRLLPLVAALAAIATACGGAGPTARPSSASASVIPVIVSSQQVVGDNRFVFSFIDPRTNAHVASPDRTASVAFIAPGATAPGPASPSTFIWAIEGTTGDYVATVSFPKAGDWTAVFITEAPGKPQEAIGVAFQVQQTGTTVAVGQPAPSVKTPTADDVGGDLARISTDAHPDPRFYRTSVDAALAAKRPFVLVFATPAFCQSATCGPALDRVKALAKDYPDLTFINVEPYQLAVTEGRLQPVLDAKAQLQPVDAVNRFALLSEPWIFVIDGSGIVRGSFEGVVSNDELKASIDGVLGG